MNESKLKEILDLMQPIIEEKGLIKEFEVELKEVELELKHLVSKQEDKPTLKNLKKINELKGVLSNGRQAMSELENKHNHKLDKKIGNIIQATSDLIKLETSADDSVKELKGNVAIAIEAALEAYRIYSESFLEKAKEVNEKIHELGFNKINGLPPVYNLEQHMTLMTKDEKDSLIRTANEFTK